ncbi:fasciclin-like arabinogalactan protein 12 [Prunus yedoensis var. nudiflora]|uniref:Fasciclin-like arabinogalactan protein 12 n=1 Tax=Prunus yedoensis var. nudiflora TaxID=2094558 RepID=A0A314Y9D0_PRUYE|nr:fasciclin-like arabinogalactan protein 12 [Prunus yedoensis var. nudiflora]
MMKQQNQPLFSLTLLLIFFSHCTKILSQAPSASPAAAPAPQLPQVPQQVQGQAARTIPSDPRFSHNQNFQTISNPVRTQAGSGLEYPLNITTSGNSVNISTGLVNTSISGTVYSDNQIAIYQVDSVLQPYGVFAPKRKLPSLAPAPAPAPASASVHGKPKLNSSSSDSDDSDTSTTPPVAEVKSGAVPTVLPKFNGIVSIAVAVVAAAALSFS